MKSFHQLRNRLFEGLPGLIQPPASSRVKWSEENSRTIKSTYLNSISSNETKAVQDVMVDT